MFLQVDWISGVMLGIEVLWGQSIVVLDIGIIRIYIGKVPEKGNTNV